MKLSECIMIILIVAITAFAIGHYLGSMQTESHMFTWCEENLDSWKDRSETISNDLQTCQGQLDRIKAEKPVRGAVNAK